MPFACPFCPCFGTLPPMTLSHRFFDVGVTPSHGVVAWRVVADPSPPSLQATLFMAPPASWKPWRTIEPLPPSSRGTPVLPAAAALISPISVPAECALLGGPRGHPGPRRGSARTINQLGQARPEGCLRTSFLKKAP